MKKIIRATTVPVSLDTFCRGMLADLSRDYEVVALSSPGEVLDKVRDREGVRTIGVKMSRRWDIVGDIVALFKLIKIFKKEKPDMVHSMTPKAGLLCMVAARVAKVPVRMHTFTGLVFPSCNGIRRRVLWLADKITCKCATHINPEGEGVMMEMMDANLTRKPLKLLGNGNVRGIDLDHYYKSTAIEEDGRQLRISMGIKYNEFVFILIGRLVGDKGINELISAFDRLRNLYPDIHLILVGKAENEFDPLKSKTYARMKTIHNLYMPGFQEDVRPWLAMADALVFPSYREGFPNVVIEAGAMGLASIVSDISGSREIIHEGENGLIIPPKDEDALYQAMKRFVENPLLVRRLASHARDMVASRYEQGFVRKCLKDYYKKILV